MDIAGLKDQARALEKAGEAAAALTIYDELLTELDRSGIVPDGALVVKIGDLSLKTGQRSRAVALFERAAEQYAGRGAEASVLALCIKILRTDPRRSDVHLRFAKQLFLHGYVDATRRVLLDYAGRTQLDKTRATLERMEGRPESEMKAKLEEFFHVAALAARRSGEHRAIATPKPGTTPSETAKRLAVVAETHAKPPAETPTPAPDPIIAEIVAKKPAAEPLLLAPGPAEPARPSLAVVEGAPAATRPARESRPVRRRRPLWTWPVAAAAAVLVLGVGLMGFGAIPFGGNLDAKQPNAAARTGLLTAAEPSTAGVTVDSTAMAVAPAFLDRVAATWTPQSLPNSAESGQVGPPLAGGPMPAAVDDSLPSRLDRRALASAAAAAAAVEVEVADVVLDSDLLGSDRIAIPSMSTTPLTGGASAPTTHGTVAPRPVIAIEGLDITGVVRMPDSYQLVQRLPSGGTVTLTVMPFENAPADESGQLRVQDAPGDSAVGSRRFRDAWVTASAPLRPAVLEGLLDKLAERSWQ